MHLDGRQLGELDRIVDRPGVVGPGAGVEDQRVGILAGAVQQLHVLALVVGLLKDDAADAQLAGVGVDLLLELIEREAAVVRRVAHAQLIEVDAMQHHHARRGHRSSSTAASTAASSSSSPQRNWPGPSTTT